MKKEELFKELNTIMLKTNGGVDDYVVALCQTSNLVSDYAKEQDRRIAVLERAFKKACKKLTDAYGECPYANMNLKMPNYCEKECENHEELLCWDNYFINQAEKELKDEKL